MTRLSLLIVCFAFGCAPATPTNPTGGGAGGNGTGGGDTAGGDGGGAAGGSVTAGGASGGSVAGGAAAGGSAGGVVAGGRAGGSGGGAAGGVSSGGGAVAGGSTAGGATAGGAAGGATSGGVAGGAVAGGAGGASIVRFVATGDTGKANTGQNDVGAAIGTYCAQHGCDFVVLLGDNFYPSGVSSVTDPLWQTAFVQPYATVTAPFYPVLGNHDYGNDGTGNDFPRGDVQVQYSSTNPKWRLPAKHYRVTHGHVELFGLDTNRTYWGSAGPGDAQVRTDIAAWLAASTATWKIALGHHPYRSNGPHGNAGKYDERCIDIAGQMVCASPPGFTDGRNVKSFMESIVCGRADLYLSGHDHSAQWLTPTCNGTELIVSGAGAATTELTMRNPSHFQTEDLGFFYFEINGRTLTGRFIDTTGAVRFTRTYTK